MATLTSDEIYAQLYDAWVEDWAGEIEFYRDLIQRSSQRSFGVLEIACGTGRVACRLAAEVLDISGFDLSPELLEIARGKNCQGLKINWFLGDMRTFEAGRQFGLAISPGHSFQFMTTPDDQINCLNQIKKHLVPDGLLVLHVDHQDFSWIAGLLDSHEPLHRKSDVILHPRTRQRFVRSWCWDFEPVTQTATVQVTWDEVDGMGNVLHSWDMAPRQLHCIFPFELEHLLRRAGFAIEAIYGDFFKNPLTRHSSEMIWIARKSTS